MILQTPVVLPGPFDAAVDRVRAAYAAAGLKIHSQADLGAITGDRGCRHVVLGAFHPETTAMALASLPEAGVVLPYNVVVREDHDRVLVEALDPQLLRLAAADDVMAAIAQELGRRSAKALANIASSNGEDVSEAERSASVTGSSSPNLDDGITVDDIMTGDLVTMRPVDSVATATKVLHETGLHALPVIDSARLVGIVTLADFYGHSGHTPLDDIIVRPPVTISSAATPADAAKLMRTEVVHHLVVVDGPRLTDPVVGVVSSLDLIRSIS